MTSPNPYLPLCGHRASYTSCPRNTLCSQAAKRLSAAQCPFQLTSVSDPCLRSYSVPSPFRPQRAIDSLPQEYYVFPGREGAFWRAMSVPDNLCFRLLLIPTPGEVPRPEMSCSVRRQSVWGHDDTKLELHVPRHHSPEPITCENNQSEPRMPRARNLLATP